MIHCMTSSLIVNYDLHGDAVEPVDVEATTISCYFLPSSLLNSNTAQQKDFISALQSRKWRQITGASLSFVFCCPGLYFNSLCLFFSSVIYYLRMNKRLCSKPFEVTLIDKNKTLK